MRLNFFRQVVRLTGYLSPFQTWTFASLSSFRGLLPDESYLGRDRLCIPYLGVGMS